MPWGFAKRARVVAVLAVQFVVVILRLLSQKGTSPYLEMTCISIDKFAEQKFKRKNIYIYSEKK